MTKESAVIELIDVTRSYAGQNIQEVYPVLNQINLQVFQGESLAVTGPSGSGKSTLINLIGTLDVPTSGVIRIEGTDPGTLSEDERSKLRNRKIGIIFQHHHLLPQFTALENVLLPTIPYPFRTTAEYRKIALELFEYTGLFGKEKNFPCELSGGEQMRVAVIRALVNGPEILLADEPTGSLDRDSALVIGRMLEGLNRDRGMTLITVTHSGEIAALMSRQYTLSGGCLSTGDAGSC